MLFLVSQNVCETLGSGGLELEELREFPETDRRVRWQKLSLYPSFGRRKECRSRHDKECVRVLRSKVQRVLQNVRSGIALVRGKYRSLTGLAVIVYVSYRAICHFETDGWICKNFFCVEKVVSLFVNVFCFVRLRLSWSIIQGDL